MVYVMWHIHFCPCCCHVFCPLFMILPLSLGRDSSICIMCVCSLYVHNYFNTALHMVLPSNNDQIFRRSCRGFMCLRFKLLASLIRFSDRPRDCILQRSVIFFFWHLFKEIDYLCSDVCGDCFKNVVTSWALRCVFFLLQNIRFEYFSGCKCVNLKLSLLPYIPWRLRLLSTFCYCGYVFATTLWKNLYELHMWLNIGFILLKPYSFET